MDKGNLDMMGFLIRLQYMDGRICPTKGILSKDDLKIKIKQLSFKLSHLLYSWPLVKKSVISLALS